MSVPSEPPSIPGPVSIAPAAFAWKRAWPLLVALLLVGIVASRLDLPSFWRAVRDIDYLGYAGFIALFNVLLLAADCFATRHVYATTIAPVGFRDLVVLRMASYLPAQLNHHVGQAWLTYFVSRVYRVSLWSVAGATLLIYVTTFGSLYILSLFSLAFPGEKPAWLLSVVIVLSVLGVGYLGALRWPPAWLKARLSFAPLLEVGITGHLRGVLFRMPHVLILMAGTWGALWFFGIVVPLGATFVVIPPLLLVAALPVTPQGVGTRELVALQLVTPFVAGTAEQRSATVAAATLVFAVSLSVLQMAVAPLFLKSAYVRLAQARAQRVAV